MAILLCFIWFIYEPNLNKTSSSLNPTMKKLTVMLSLAALGASAMQAQEELSVTTTFAWESSYVFRGAQLAEETFMPGLDLAYGAWYGGIWAAMPADDDDANEVDFYTGYGFAISDTASADIGITYYSYPSSSDEFLDGDVNTTEIYAGLSFEVPFSPSIYVYYDFDLENFTVEGSGGYSWEVSEAAAVDLSLYLGHVSVDTGDDYTYYGAGLSYGYTFNDSVGGSIYANWAGASEDLMYDGDDNEVWFGFSVTAGF